MVNVHGGRHSPLGEALLAHRVLGEIGSAEALPFLRLIDELPFGAALRKFMLFFFLRRAIYISHLSIFFVIFV